MRTRLWWRRGAILAATTVGLAALLAAGAAVFTLNLAVIETGVATGLACLVFVVFRRTSLPRVARYADRSVGLENRLATALEILDGRLRGDLASLQLADTWRACRAYTPAQVIPALDVRVSVALIAAVLELVLAVMAVANADLLRSWLGAPFAADASNSGLMISPVQTDSSTAVGGDPTLAAAQRMDDTSAVTSARLRQEVQQRDDQSRAFEAAAAKLADAFKATSAAQYIGVSLDRADYDTAAQQLRDLARESDQLSAASRQQLARSLLQASKESAAVDQALATSEQLAAQALGRGEYESARKALENLAGVIAAQQRASVPASDVARALQQLQLQPTGALAPAGSCGGDEYGGPVDCTQGALYSSGAMRTSPPSEVPSAVAGGTEIGRGSGYGTGGDGPARSGIAITRLGAPAENVVQVDVAPSSAQGRGREPDPQASSTIISEAGQKDVVLQGQPQSAQAIDDPFESTVVSPAQRQVVRDFFRPRP